MLSTKLKAAAGNSSEDATPYVDDVFSTWLYTGNGSTQTITNGIDLAGKGGLTWLKSRSAATDHKLTDTVRGTTKALISDTAGAQTTDANGLTAFNSTGFSLGTDSVYNTNAATYVSWTFREAAKFFDVVTYTGTGSARTIAHNLGSAPGMVIVKRTDTSSDWQVYSNGLTSAAYSIQLNLTAAQASAPTVWNSTAPTSSVFSVGTDATVNASGGTYVAYLYANDTSANGIIQCGSYNGNTGVINPVTLGWEPQYVMVKCSNTTDGYGWGIIDTMRGFTVPGSTAAGLLANTSGAEFGGNYLSPTATGFTANATAWNETGKTYIYMAIRMPNKPPTTGTQVYNAIARTGTGTTITTNAGITPDMTIIKNKSSAIDFLLTDRLLGYGNLATNTTAAFSTGNGVSYDVINGVMVNNNVTQNYSGYSYVDWYFKRAPGFFDEVCYTGTGSATTQAHNLTVVPELMIVKERSAVNNWWVYAASIGNTKYSVLNSTATPVTSSTAWNNTTPTASVFSIGTGANVNASTQTFVAYLFATLAGISKVGSYTGNGSSQNIECGFAAGARFFLVKATSTTGSWWVWDSARGITAGNDPALQLNSTAAEITTADAVDPYSPGITVNQEATCSINASGVSYIFLAVA